MYQGKRTRAEPTKGTQKSPVCRERPDAVPEIDREVTREEYAEWLLRQLGRIVLTRPFRRPS